MAAPETKPQWPVAVDERDMDEVRRLSERELALLDKLLEANLEANRLQSESLAQGRETKAVHAALLAQLQKTDVDQEKRIRMLERLYWGATGAIGLILSTLGLSRLWGWLVSSGGK